MAKPETGEATWPRVADLRRKEADLEVGVRLCQQAETKAGLGAVLNRLKAFILALPGGRYYPQLMLASVTIGERSGNYDLASTADQGG